MPLYHSTPGRRLPLVSSQNYQHPHASTDKTYPWPDCNGVKLSMIDGDGPENGSSTTGVDIATTNNAANLDNHPYL